jgi:hypothetical protein
MTGTMRAATVPRRTAFVHRREGVEYGQCHNRNRHAHSLSIHDPNGYGVELLYELPRAVREDDIDGALNYSVSLPTEGPEALSDRTEDLPSFTR